MEPLKHRLFFALWPEADTREALAGIIQPLKPRLAARWVRPQNLHITLAFLGDVEAERLDAVDAAADHIQAPRFELSLDTMEYWRRPQILCLSPSVPAPALGQLAADLASQLRTAGFALETRPYRAHLTLARNARGLPVDAQLEQPVRWQATAFVRVESTQDSRGTCYRLRKTWPLG